MTCFYQVSSEFLVFHGVISEYWQRNGLSGFEQNQFLIISKLFLLSAEFFVSFSWNDWAIIFLTCIFFLKNIMWQFFLNIFDGFDISWSGALIRVLYLLKFISPDEADGVLKKRAGIRCIPCISMFTKVLRYCFVIVLVRILLCWSSKSAKSRLP